MANLLKDCPFPVDTTLLDSKVDCSKEIHPYKSLDDITKFLHFISSGKHFPWMDMVKDLQPSTDYCYVNEPTVDDEKWFPKRRVLRDSVPKTLLCHDYKGNYLDDRFIYGTDKPNSYNFYNWTCIDIFVYFSHEFVTVPTLTWINAAHENGVPILGTIITEPPNGEPWKVILESETKLQWFADVLSLIAAIHKFDGYLVNIESPLPQDLTPNLLTFLKLLKQNLKDRKHSKTYLIWYDAVTINGSVNYQNELNMMNKSFFDICDGIFLNYNWTSDRLKKSREMAGARAHDVFVGIDVFGRNTRVGGGFDTNQALEMVRKEDLSAAIFAMGWTEEAIPGDFRINDMIFWSKLWPYFYVKGIKKLPFSTDFNRGYGTKKFAQGIAKDEPWFNLVKQSYQNTFCHLNFNTNSEVIQNIIKKIYLIKKMDHEGPEKEKELQILNLMYKDIDKTVLQYTTEEGFNGGGCLKINPSVLEKENKKQKYVTLFLCDFEVKKDWSVTVASKRIFGGNAITSNKYPYLYMILQTEEKQLVKKKLKDSVSVTNYYRGLSNVGEYYSGFTSYDWVVRKYLVSEKGRILEVGICVSRDDSEMFLGKIDIAEW